MRKMFDAFGLTIVSALCGAMMINIIMIALFNSNSGMENILLTWLNGLL